MLALLLAGPEGRRGHSSHPARAPPTACLGAPAWQRFLAERVTPRFPSGFTVIDTTGQWQQRSAGRIIQQPSTVIEIAAPHSAEVIAKLEEIRAECRSAFRQESVGLVVTENCFSF